MQVQSPLKKTKTRPNLRIVPKPIQTEPGKTEAKNNTRFSAKAKSVQKTISGIRVKPGTVILMTVIAGVLGFLYLTHVFSTQKLLNEVQQLEAEYNKSRNTYDVLKIKYDRMVGPAEIYRKADAAGFINGGPADKVINIDK